MGSRNLFIILFFSGMLFIFACAPIHAPKGWLPDAEEAQKAAFGAWITVEYENDSNRSKVSGEFLAIDSGNIYVMTNDGLAIIGRQGTNKAKLTAYDSKSNLLGTWTLVGTLSTLSHGVILIISAPVWIIAGSAATGGQSYMPVEKYPGKSWEELKKYSRYPQGLSKELLLSLDPARFR